MFFFIDNRQPEKAIQSLQEAVKQFESASNIWYTLADLLKKQGHMAAALQTIEKAIEINPSAPVSYSLKGEILSYMGKETTWQLQVKHSTRQFVVQRQESITPRIATS